VPHDAAAIRARLAELGVRPARRYGQSFLADPFVADMAAALVEAPRGTPLTEIGGGLGLLTEALLRRGLGPLRVLERDPRLAAHLGRAFGPAIEVRCEDALAAEFGPERPVVGNLPFSVASPILTRLFDRGVPSIVAMLQKEVGQRYAASPGGRRYGRPSLQVARYGSAELFAPVPARSFVPAPEVDGILVRFRRRDGPAPVADGDAFEALVARLFRTRRKQLRNLLPAVAGGPEAADAAARAAGWPADWARRRPEEMAPAAYFALARVLAGPRRPGRPASSE
jgi:16S rRNA (adenine1518-N6/adenine1519-N6)-dimethyltransferase